MAFVDMLIHLSTIPHPLFRPKGRGITPPLD